MSTRALTPYNRHVRSFAKTYKGKNLMKAAAAAWNKKSGKPKSKTVKTVKARSRSSKVKKTGKNGKMFRTLGAQGALEDFAWGFGGIALMGRNNPVALPAIRLVQGVQGHVLNRTGKGRLVYAIIDLADLVITGQASIQEIFDNLRQLTKVSSLVKV